MTTVEQLPGDPGSLSDKVATLEADVSAIDRAIDQLYDTNVQLTGRAADELYARSLDAAIQMERARDRYDGTADALRTYSVEMEGAHRQADAALDQAPAAIAERDSAVESVTRLRQLVVQAQADGLLTSEVQRLENDLYLARRREDRAVTALASIESSWTAARDRQQAAAAVAAAQILDAMEETNNSFLDNVGAFFSWVGEGLASVGTWLVEALRAVGEFLWQFAGMLLVFAAVLVAVALLALVFPVIAVIGVFTVAVIAFAAIASVLVVASLAADSTGMHPGEEYPTEVRTADPERSPETTVKASYESLIADLAEVDRGTHERPVFGPDGQLVGWEPREDPASMVKVVALRDEDTGEVIGWRVHIPSTQEWGITSSSLNDLPTNVLHALVPGRENAMEQAVWDAMSRAGALDSEAPVMIAGWSQGGMTAGEIAIDDRLSGREISVVAAGSPMDQYRNEFSQQGVRATVFTHPDGVSGLEGVRLSPADVVGRDPNFVQHFEATLAHDAVSYSQQAARTQMDLRGGDEVFFANFGEGVVEEVQMFEYSRRDHDPAPRPVPTPSPQAAPTPPVTSVTGG